MACSSGCALQNHASWGECVRSKSLEVADVAAHKYNQAQNSQMNEYVKARYAGLQPKSVFKKDVDAAWRITEAQGSPYRADKQ